ncbi:MAG: hypothetical protein HDS15_01780 [Bacteroides sp.]|nr:hypothetical protein [Bacteroides sp.]
MKKLLSLCSVCLLLTVACSRKDSGRSDPDATFMNEIKVSADSVEMSVVIKPGNIFRADPYIVVSDVEHANGLHFAVFNDSLRYLYSFCPYGPGPEECLMPMVVNNMPESRFIVRDHGDGRYHSYILTDSGAVNSEVFAVREFSPYESVMELNFCGGSRYMMKGISPRHIVRRLVDFSTETVLDSINSPFSLKEEMGKDYYSEFEDFWMVVNNSRFATAYFLIDRLEFGIIDSDSLHIVKYWGGDKAPEFYRYTDEKLTGKYEYNVDYNIVYYEWLYASDNYVYASYFGKPWGDLKEHSNIIRVYGFSGEPLLQCNLDVSLASFIVMDDSRLIGINPDRSDDQFYCYSLK